MTEPSWDFYRSFLEVARRGSLSAAARQLGLAQPTLGRHVAALEEALGAKLFSRSPQGLILTRAGEALRSHAELMASAAAALARAASGEAESVEGTVRITASQFMGAEVLPAILTDFRRAHPRIAIELALTDRNEDLLKREADIAVRMMRPKQAALVARRIGDVGIGLFAHRRYLREAGTPRTREDLAGHNLIGFDRDDSAFRALGAPARLVSRALFALRSDSDLAQLAALRAGFGIGGCQVPVARRDRALIPILPNQIAFRLEIWLAMHEDLRGQRRTRLLYDHLGRGLAAYVAEGGPPPARQKRR